MTDDRSKLKYVGTQSHETMAMEAALAREAERDAPALADRIADGGVPNGGFAGLAVGKTRRSAQPLVERIGVSLEGYVTREPVRASLIAAGVGALTMALVAIAARSALSRMGALR